MGFDVVTKRGGEHVHQRCYENVSTALLHRSDKKNFRAHLPRSHMDSAWPSVAASLNQAAAAPKSRLPPGKEDKMHAKK